MVKRIECIVSAERVGYNYLLWISKIAIRLGLVGTARTLGDGSIKIIAEGDDEVLADFMRRVQRGHPIFHMFVTINNFSVRWHEPTGEFKEFYITVDRD